MRLSIDIPVPAAERWRREVAGALVGVAVGIEHSRLRRMQVVQPMHQQPAGASRGQLVLSTVNEPVAAANIRDVESIEFADAEIVIAADRDGLAR